MAKHKILAIILNVLTFGIAVFRMITDQSDVIVHWGTSGRWREYGPFWSIIFLPIVSVLLFVLVSKNKPINHSLTVNYKKKYARMLLPLLALIFLYLTICAAGYAHLHPLILLVLVLFCCKAAFSHINRK